MKTHTTAPPNGSKTSEIPALKPALAHFMRVLWAAALMLPAFVAHAGVVFTSIYSFPGGNDGATPNGLVQGSDGNSYGTTSGLNQVGNNSYGNGTVFRVNTDGSDFTTLREAEGSRINAYFRFLPACRSGLAGEPLKRHSRAGQSRPNAAPAFSKGSSGSFPLSATPVFRRHLSFSI